MPKEQKETIENEFKVFRRTMSEQTANVRKRDRKSLQIVEPVKVPGGWCISPFSH